MAGLDGAAAVIASPGTRTGDRDVKGGERVERVEASAFEPIQGGSPLLRRVRPASSYPAVLIGSAGP